MGHGRRRGFSAEDGAGSPRFTRESQPGEVERLASRTLGRGLRRDTQRSGGAAGTQQAEMGQHGGREAENHKGDSQGIRPWPGLGSGAPVGRGEVDFPRACPVRRHTVRRRERHEGEEGAVRHAFAQGRRVFAPVFRRHKQGREADLQRGGRRRPCGGPGRQDQRRRGRLQPHAVIRTGEEAHVALRAGAARRRRGNG